MNMFLHDFKTLEDFNDVAEWIKSSGLDPKNNAIAFLSALEHQKKGNINGTLLIGDTVTLLALLTQGLFEVVKKSTSTRDSALHMAGAIAASLSYNIFDYYTKLERGGAK